MKRGFVVRLLENFLCAGSSAMLIPIAHLETGLWPVSAFALIPFLWRCSRVSLLEAAALAGVLAASYDFLTVPVASWIAPGAFLFKLLSLNLLFAVLAIAANRLTRYFGSRFILIAVAWFPIEHTLTSYARFGSIFAFSESDSTLLIRIVSLCGILLVSLAVVLVNWVILSLLGRVLQALRGRRTFPGNGTIRLSLFIEEKILQIGWYYFTDPRAPPQFPAVSMCHQ
jgi:hypothetical protein